MDDDEDAPFSLKNPIIERPPPNAVVYDLSAPDRATIILPAGSTWTSGLHWHEHHTEYLRVLQGSITVTLGSQPRQHSSSSITLTPADDELRIEPYVWHEWQRSSSSTTNDEDAIVQERTDPDDSAKAVFFWNLNGVLLLLRRPHISTASCPPYMWRRAHAWLVDAWVLLHLLAICAALDNVPVFVHLLDAFAKRGFVFPDGTLGALWLRSVDRAVSRLVLFVAAWLAWVLGIRAVTEQRTPRDVLARWEERRRGARLKKS